jgi:hypothetical protein
MRGGVVHSRILKLALIWGAADVARLIGRIFIWLDQALPLSLPIGYAIPPQ